MYLKDRGPQVPSECSKQRHLHLWNLLGSSFSWGLCRNEMGGIAFWTEIFLEILYHIWNNSLPFLVARNHNSFFWSCSWNEISFIILLQLFVFLRSIKSLLPIILFLYFAVISSAIILPYLYSNSVLPVFSNSQLSTFSFW